MPRAKYDRSGRTLLAVVSDLHVGGSTSICPKKIPLEDGGEYVPAPIQNWMRDRWTDFWNLVSPYKTRGWNVVVVVAGEAIENAHHRTPQLAAQSPETMVDAALNLLARPRNLAHEMLFVRGTEAHSGLGGHIDVQVARELGGKIDTATGTRAAYQWVIDIGGVIVDIAHHVGGGIHPARLELQKVVMDYDARRQPAPDLIVRGHIHRPEIQWLNNRCSVVTPAWQGKTAYAHKITRNLSGSVGGLLCEIYDRQMFPRLIQYPYEVALPVVLQSRALLLNNRVQPPKTPTQKSR